MGTWMHSVFASMFKKKFDGEIGYFKKKGERRN